MVKMVKTAQEVRSMAKGHERGEIKLENKKLAKGIFPRIISASRSTDIPAFYLPWLFHRLDAGYVTWINPFNQMPQYVSLEKARAYVFWSKNPRPLLDNIEKVEKKIKNFYIQFTLNDYEMECLEPVLPPLEERIDTFKGLSEKIGKGRVIWRFDPLVLGESLTVDVLLERIEKLAEALKESTNKLVFSFVDINKYKKTENKLKKIGTYREFSGKERNSMAQKLSAVIKPYGLTLATCAESDDFQEYGIEKNKCIDDELLRAEFPHYDESVDSIDGKQRIFPVEQNKRAELKDPGQRKECGCILSKDIGGYNTCPHLCRYCYANRSDATVKKRYMAHKEKNPSIV